MTEAITAPPADQWQTGTISFIMGNRKSLKFKESGFKNAEYHLADGIDLGTYQKNDTIQVVVKGNIIYNLQSLPDADPKTYEHPLPPNPAPAVKKQAVLLEKGSNFVMIDDPLEGMKRFLIDEKVKDAIQHMKRGCFIRYTPEPGNKVSFVKEVDEKGNPVKGFSSKTPRIEPIHIALEAAGSTLLPAIEVWKKDGGDYMEIWNILQSNFILMTIAGEKQVKKLREEKHD